MQKLPEYIIGGTPPDGLHLSPFHWEAYASIRDGSFTELLRTTAARRAYFIHIVTELEKLGLVSPEASPLTFEEWAGGNGVPTKKTPKKAKAPAAPAPKKRAVRRAASDVHVEVRKPKPAAVTLDL